MTGGCSDIAAKYARHEVPSDVVPIARLFNMTMMSDENLEL